MQDGGGDAWDGATLACPKSMRHGPCAGVDTDGDCEVPDVGRCSFVDLDPTTWPYGQPAAAAPQPREFQPREFQPRETQSAPLIIADLPAAPLSSASIRTAAGILAGQVDACLLGDNGLERVQYPPSYRVRLLADAGLAAWAGLNCRDRNRVALEGEVAACLDAGAVGLHCVTGDHPARGGRPDALAVFDLDALDLVSLAAGSGVPCSVAHAPDAPPRDIRLPRLLAKIAAGADSVFIDHCGGPAHVATAVAALRATGFGGSVIACVPVVIDAESAKVLLSFAAATVPPGYVEQVMSAADPNAAGIAAAIDLSTQLLAIPGVDGVNLSGGSLLRDELTVAFADIAAGVRATAGQHHTPVPVGARA